MHSNWEITNEMVRGGAKGDPTLMLTLSGVVTEEVKSTFKGIKNGLYPVQKVIPAMCLYFLFIVGPFV
jgi:hypothetical protein